LLAASLAADYARYTEAFGVAAVRILLYIFRIVMSIPVNTSGKKTARTFEFSNRKETQISQNNTRIFKKMQNLVV